jgi:CheY-like chemotaxis protein/HPt (histidine-containing phosphotransfer) domain-containing protein
LASFLILLVDDDDLSRDLIALYLEAEGHQVIKSGSGHGALLLLRPDGSSAEKSTTPDVLLTDIQMPEMTGQELCRRIRTQSNQGQGHLPLLIGMSATRPPEEQLQEFDAFVNKPLDTQAFQKVLMDRLGRPRTISTDTKQDEIPAPPLDNTVVDKRRKLMHPAALDELFATYLSDTRVRLSQMEAHAAAGDIVEVRRCAHMMKGSAAMTGASGIRRVAALLETTTISADRQRVLFDELRCACDAIEGTLARDARNKEAHDHQTT